MQTHPPHSPKAQKKGPEKSSETLRQLKSAFCEVGLFAYLKASA